MKPSNLFICLILLHYELSINAHSLDNDIMNISDSEPVFFRRWSNMIGRFRRTLADTRGNASDSKRYAKLSITYTNIRRPSPAKRDFQDHDPPRTPEELYSRYDPTVAVSTGVVLGGILGFVVGRVLIKCVVRLTKKRLRKTKRFAKYFPERELPPLHIAQQFAREQGVALPESLISKLVRCGSDSNLKTIADASRSPAAVTTAVVSPLILQADQSIFDSIHSPTNELLGLIRLNVIGATPCLQNSNINYLPKTTEEGKRVKNPKSISKRSIKSDTYDTTYRSENGHLNAHAKWTKTEVETQPLLLPTTMIKSGKNIMLNGGKRNVSNNSMTGNKFESTNTREPMSISSYGLGNGGTIENIVLNNEK